MSQQTLNYIEDMNNMYSSIMGKVVNNEIVTDLEVLFLKVYERTMENVTPKTNF